MLVHFPFTDLSSEKLRPALVLVPENRTGDVVLAFVTTQIEDEDLYDILISEKDKDFKRTGLKKTSLIKVNKITTLHKKMLLGKIGELSFEKMKEVNSILKKLLQLS